MNDEIIVVTGAGSAGIAAAITAARMKIPVVLIEKSGTLGGTVTNSLIHTLAGIFSFHAEPINGGIITELVQRLEKADSSTQKRKISRNWVLSCSPEVYQNVVEKWVAEEPNIELRTECLIQSIEYDSGCVHAITIADNSNHCRIGVRGLIDTTGAGQALQLVDTGLVDAGGPLASDGQIFVLRGVAPEALDFPDNVKYTHAIRKAVENGQLPPELNSTWIDKGVYRDEAYVKITRERQQTNDSIDILVDFLHTFSSFSQSYIFKKGKRGRRDCGKVLGDYCLSENDILSGRKFDDAACRCCWPIEHWDPVKGVTIKYPQTEYYEIPLRALKVQNFENLWVAGKCFSADWLARSSARVVGTCWSMGEAAAKALVEEST